jgi:Flp pilus assembly protein TadG
MMIMLFSTIEMGSLVGDYITVNAAARAGVRIAATGAPIASITQRVSSITATLVAARLTTSLQYRTSSSGTWSDWTTITDTTLHGVAVNSAPSASEIRVLLSYSHPLVIPKLFSVLADNPPANDSRTINLSAYMQRE